LLFTPTPISLVIAVSALVSVFTAFASWQRRQTRGGMYFAMAMVAMSVYVIAAGLDYAAVTTPLKILFAKVEALDYNDALAFLAAFTFFYAGHENALKNFWVRIFLIFIPQINILLAWTNELHGWYWSAFFNNPQATYNVVFVHGPAFLWASITGYLFLMLIAANLFYVARTGARLARRQSGLLLLSLVIAAASNLLYLFDIFNLPGVDWDPITSSFTSLLFLTALYRTGFMDLVPVARNTVVENLPDSILVLDEKNRLADFNLAAKTIFALRQADLWKPVSEVMAGWPEMLAALSSYGERPQEIVTGVGARVFELRQILLTDQLGGSTGHLLMLRDFSERVRIEEALRISEEKFYKAFHAGPEAILITNLADGRILEVNESFCRLTGFSRQEALVSSTRDLDLWVNPADRAELVKEMQRSGILHDREYQIRKKSGDILTASLAADTIHLHGETHIISTLIDITYRKQVETLLLTSQIKQAAAEERLRVARSLHDSVSQSIHSLVFFSETLDALIERGSYERARQVTRQLQQSARQAHKETRLLLFDLQSAIPERRIDLVHDLDERLTRVERYTGIRADLVQDGELLDCPEELIENLYWIANEALNNILKHARAHSLRVTLSFKPAAVFLEILDDGIGFDPLKAQNGLGLNIMRARAEQTGGELTIQPGPSGGTLLQLRIDKKGFEHEPYQDIDRR